MAVGTEANKISYTCSIGGPQSFTFPYAFYDETDLIVQLYVGGTLVDLVLGSDYDVSAISGGTFTNGGVVSFVEDKWSGTLIITRVLPLLQLTDYQDYSNFPADVFESDLDKIVMMTQQLNEKIGRQIAAPVADSDPQMELPIASERAGLFLAFDAQGDVIVADTLGTGVPVTAWAQTLLDDADQSTGQNTLGVHVRTWDASIGYLAGYCCGYQGVIYRALQNNTNQNPATQLDYWWPITKAQGTYTIAAYDAPTRWKAGAQTVLASASTDLSAFIYTLIQAGWHDFILTPGSYLWDSDRLLDTGEDMRIKGSGPTTIITAGSNVSDFMMGIVYPPTTPYQLHLRVENLTISDGGYAVQICGSDASSALEMAQEFVDCDVIITGSGPKLSQMWTRRSVVKGCRVTVTVTSGDCSAIGCHRVMDTHVHFESCTTSGSLIGISGKNISNCVVTAASTGSSASLIGYSGCRNISACYFFGSNAGTSEQGYYNCWAMSACTAENVKGYCFYGCNRMSACYAFYSYSDGFNSCNELSCCQSYYNDGDGFDTCRRVIGCSARNSDGYGFKGCTHCQQNEASSNALGNYNTSYADISTNACANTAAGGYNDTV